MKEYNRIPPARLCRAIAIAGRYATMRDHLWSYYTKEPIKLEDILTDNKWNWDLDSWFLAN